METQSKNSLLVGINEVSEPETVTRDTIIRPQGNEERKETPKKKNIKPPEKSKNICFCPYFYDFYRIITSIEIISFLGLIVYSYIFFIREGIKHNYILLCFEFDPTGYYPFRTDKAAIVLLFLILFGLLLIICNFFILNDIKKIKSFYEAHQFFFHINIACLGGSFIVGLLYLRDYDTLSIQLALSATGLICMSIVTIRDKKKKYSSIFSLLMESFIPPILMALDLFMIVNLCIELVSRTPWNIQMKTEFKSQMTIGGNIFILFIGIAVLTINKDILFPLSLVILETGMMTNGSNYTFWEMLSCILVVLFIFGSVTSLIFKKKKEVFRISFGIGENDMLKNDSLETHN